MEGFETSKTVFKRTVIVSSHASVILLFLSVATLLTWLCLRAGLFSRVRIACHRNLRLPHLNPWGHRPRSYVPRQADIDILGSRIHTSISCPSRRGSLPLWKQASPSSTLTSSHLGSRPPLTTPQLDLPAKPCTSLSLSYAVTTSSLTMSCPERSLRPRARTSVRRHSQRLPHLRRRVG